MHNQDNQLEVDAFLKYSLSPVKLDQINKSEVGYNNSPPAENW